MKKQSEQQFGFGDMEREGLVGLWMCGWDRGESPAGAKQSGGAGR